MTEVIDKYARRRILVLEMKLAALNGAVESLLHAYNYSQTNTTVTCTKCHFSISSTYECPLADCCHGLNKDPDERQKHDKHLNNSVELEAADIATSVRTMFVKPTT